MSLRTIHIHAGDIKEGIEGNERLKYYTVHGHGGDVAENLYRLRKKMASLIERRKTLDEVYIRKDMDGESVPDSKPKIEVDRYIGAYRPDRKYKAGAILSHKGVMFEVQNEVKGVEPPGDDYVAVGKVVEGSFRVKDGYHQDVMKLETELQAVHIRTIPKEKLDEIKDLPGVCFWMPMLEMDLDDVEEKEAVETIKTNGQLVEAEG